MKKSYKLTVLLLPLIAGMGLLSCNNNDVEVTAITYQSIDVTSNSGTMRGTVSVSGTSIKDAGICFSASVTYPKLANSRHVPATGNLKDFNVTLTGLSKDSTYKYRTYVITTDSTYYGTTYSFTPAEIDMELVHVDGGTFKMGASDEKNADKCEIPAHTVTLDSYDIGKYEVTNAQFAAFLNSRHIPSGGSGVTASGSSAKFLVTGTLKSLYYNSTDSKWIVPSGYESKPVIKVTWYGANEFCVWAGGKLPTEAEWEFAARGGNKSHSYIYSGSNQPSDVGWYSKNSIINEEIPTHAGGEKNANELGIYDMSGNVWEWCSDWYTDYLSGSVSNPVGPSDKEAKEAGITSKVRRGGGWADTDSTKLRVTYRASNSPTDNGGSMGFRFAK